MTSGLRNRPFNRLDTGSRMITDSVDDEAFRAEYSGGNIIYKGFARPGADEGQLVWQIAKLAYDGSNNLLSITWPKLASGSPSNDYIFSWTARASYTYS